VEFSKGIGGCWVMLKIYTWFTNRNKRDVSINKLKNGLFLINNQCYLCDKEFYNIRELELEHKIPVMLGGDITDINNLALVCRKCHKGKTIIDLKIIRGLKSLGIITGKFQIDSLWNREKIKEFYLNNFNLIREKYIIDTSWDKEEYELINEDKQNGL
jgi:hypothetical protein